MRASSLTFLLSLLLVPFGLNAEQPAIKVGAIFSLSGWAALGGQPEQNATQMALDEINGQGGIHGRKLEIVYEDNRSDLADTVSALNKLISADKVVAILGPNWAEFAEVAAPICDQKKIPLLTASGYTPTLTKGRKFVFTDVPEFRYHILPLAEYIHAQKHTRVVILHSSSTYFDGIAGAVSDELARLGTSVRQTIALNPKEKDLRTLAMKLQRDKVDGIVAFLQEGGDMSNFFRQLRTIQFSPAVYSYDLTYDEELSKDWRSAEGAVFFSYTGVFDPQMRARYVSRFKMEPPWTVPKAYDNVYVLKKALEDCGTEPQQIRDCLSRTDYTGASGRIHFSDSGVIDVNTSVSALRKVVNGHPQPLS